MRCLRSVGWFTVVAGALGGALQAAELIWPQGRQAFYAQEPIEWAVAGLSRGGTATLELLPRTGTALPVALTVQGDGSTVTLTLPPGTLAAGSYVVKLDGQEVATLTVSSGVVDSTLLLSQTLSWEQLQASGANFLLGNAFSFGKLSPDGTGPLTTNLRANRSPGLEVFERAIAANLPTLVYMYWTGYVTHKPFGSEKSWAATDVIQATRLLNFHTAQRLRRFGRNILSIGTIDEPGLSWGKTPTGGSASGFPNWDEQEWYEQRSWKYTNDPASRPEADWMKYLAIRCAILKESMAQAKQDLRAVWPGVPFSTDLYAPQAIMDGTDPLNQQVNDFPSSHVFVDWGIDRLGAYSGICLEKAHDPTSRMAHAMNGQLFGELVPQPHQLHAYRVALNGMLAAGLRSNWWLNTGGMTPADLAAVNQPAKRVGPLLLETDLGDHDVAVLWSFTELAMREKAITAREARKKRGGKITLQVKSLPRNTALKSKEVEINAYSLGGDYKEAVLTAHYALSRAGYPAHILHERLLPQGLLKHYKTLVIVGQTFAFPPEVQQALSQFTARGGKIVVDQSTTVRFDRALRAAVNLKGLSYRWGVLFTEDPKSFQTAKEASFFQTNYFMDEAVRRAVVPFKQAMQKTASRPCLETESDELVVERHRAGEGFLYLVINGYEELPEIADREKYWIYNYAPYQAKYTLQNLPDPCVAYVLEGADWSKAGRLADPWEEITGRFEPGEMKLYLVAPREPAGLDVAVAAGEGDLTVSADLKGLKMPWPLAVTVQGPDGQIRYDVYRATRPDGKYEEKFPLGRNAPAGTYTVRVSSPVADLAAEAGASYRPTPVPLQQEGEPVRAFDREAIRAFLAKKPEVTIAVGSLSHQALAERLAEDLAACGLKVEVQPEAKVLKKVRYPRVWNPYAKVYRATGPAGLAGQSLQGHRVENRITLATTEDGSTTAHTEDGKELADWKLPNSLITIAGEGYTDWSGDAEVCYEPGVVLYLDAQRQLTILRGTLKEEPTTPEFRARWAKPWTRSTSHVGAYQLPPQLPEAYTADCHLILLGDSTTSLAVAVLQASDLLLQVVDEKYPGPAKALLSFVWSPFAVEKDVILIGATDLVGLEAGRAQLLTLAPR